MRSAGADARPPTTALRTSHGIRPVPPLESPQRGASSFADRMPGTSGRYRAVPRPSEDPDRVRRRCGRCPPRPASGRWCLRPPTRDTLLPTPWRRTLAQGDPGPAATPSHPVSASAWSRQAVRRRFRSPLVALDSLYLSTLEPPCSIALAPTWRRVVDAGDASDLVLALVCCASEVQDNLTVIVDE